MRWLPIIIAFLLLVGIGFAQAQLNPGSCDVDGNEKNIFYTTEPVYVLGLTVYCPNLDPDTGNGYVKLYIVNDKNNWQPNDPLTDVRGAPMDVQVQNWNILVTKIWDSPSPGDYDIVIDCDPEDGLYEPGDPLDSNEPIGFSVITPPGSASAGENSPGSHSWWYDPNADPRNVMLQIKIVPNAKIQLSKIVLQASGSGNDANDITIVRVLRDLDADGKPSKSDIEIGSGKYSQDNGKLTLTLCSENAQPCILSPSAPAYFLIVYEMSNTSQPGSSYSFTVNAIYALDLNTGQTYSLPGTPIKSATKTTTSPPPCGGNLTLVLPPRALVSENITASIGTLSGCEGKLVKLMLGAGYCNELVKDIKNLVGNCSISGGGCEINFTTPSSPGNYTYTACIDKNEDGLYSGPGEEDSETIQVEKPVCGPENCAGCLSPEECAQANCSWCGGDNSCKKIVECQPPESKDRKYFCDLDCSWAACAGTQESCYSENGMCVGCTEGQVCSNYTCVQACQGNVKLRLEVAKNVRALISGLSGCDGFIAGLYKDSCTGELVTNCTIQNGSCEAQFELPKPGEYTYVACVDKNANGIYEEGEYAAVSLKPGLPEFVPEPIRKISENISPATPWAGLVIFILIVAALIIAIVWLVWKFII